jgi:putative chitinase
MLHYLHFNLETAEIKDIRYVAYILATAKHETDNTFQPITEFNQGSDSYFDKYDAGTSIGKRLGNTEPGDGFLYRGRGYIQIVGRTNYQKLNEVLGLVGTDKDLVADPDNALAPQIAYRILSYGMRMGSFTGKKLSDYIESDHTDYKNARRIINGLDRAEQIAGDAQKFEAILRVSLASKD